MKLLLTSGGVTTPAIHSALVGMLPKPISESTALCIPTAQYGHPYCTPTSAYRFVQGDAGSPMTSLGWASVGLLELTAVATMPRERWVPWVREADVLLVDGGDATYLAHWMRACGLVDLLPELVDTVWVGVSAGTMVMTPRIGREFVEWADAPDDSTLGVVDFSVFPHLDHPDMPENTLAEASSWAAGVGRPAYAIDDRSAISVVDGMVEVISDGGWHRFEG